MKTKSQVTLFLENQPGTMARACSILKREKINIQAFTLFGTVDHGVLRIIVEDPKTTVSVLGAEGFLAIESEVIEIEAPDTPGVLHRICGLLAREGINIEYGYGSTARDGGRDRIFLQASDNAGAIRVLRERFGGGEGGASPSP